LLDALIVGGDSFIGAALFARLKSQGYEVRATSRKTYADRPPRTKASRLFLDLYRPTPLPHARVTYLLAGITKFKQITSDLNAAARVNVTGNIAVAAYQRRRGGRIVFMSSSSTEHVPMHEHGMLKFATEIALLSAFGDDVAIVRCGPIMREGRECYPDNDYQPLSLEVVIDFLSTFVTEEWRPGLKRLGALAMEAA